jgi:hypothetical protein
VAAALQCDIVSIDDHHRLNHGLAVGRRQTFGRRPRIRATADTPVPRRSISRPDRLRGRRDRCSSRALIGQVMARP